MCLEYDAMLEADYRKTVEEVELQGYSVGEAGFLGSNNFNQYFFEKCDKCVHEAGYAVAYKSDIDDPPQITTAIVCRACKDGLLKVHALSA